MSYDITIATQACSCCGRSNADGMQPTYNLAPIFKLALGYAFRDLSDKRDYAVEDDIRQAIIRLRDAELRPAFKALEPENGWGDIDGAIRVFEWMLATFERYREYGSPVITIT